MNTVLAYIFQNIEKSCNLIMVWEKTEISDMYDNTDYRCIGSVWYDTEKHIIED